MDVVLSLSFILIFLIANEVWWRQKSQHTEFSRKLVHIVVGSFVAFWPFFLSWTTIELLSLAFLMVVLISKKMSIFRAIHRVDRVTWGEVFFALAVGLVALISHNPWIYMTAILQMGLADGLAAIFGISYGDKYKYKIFGHTKSIIGSLTFLIVAFTLLVGYWLFAPKIEFSYYFILIALVETVLENLSLYGLDNLVIPVACAVALRLS